MTTPRTLPVWRATHTPGISEEIDLTLMQRLIMVGAAKIVVNAPFHIPTSMWNADTITLRWIDGAQVTYYLVNPETLTADNGIIVTPECFHVMPQIVRGDIVKIADETIAGLWNVAQVHVEDQSADIWRMYESGRKDRNIALADLIRVPS